MKEICLARFIGCALYESFTEDGDCMHYVDHRCFVRNRKHREAMAAKLAAIE